MISKWWDAPVFPDFDKILDFTSDGSEASVSVAVNGDTDKEYKIVARNLSTTNTVVPTLNGDSTAGHYGYQYILNNGGVITAARGTDAALAVTNALSECEYSLLTPSGFIKTCFIEKNLYTSGTTMGLKIELGYSYNSTSNITTIGFASSSGNFTSGTRIIVYKRRVN